MSVDGRKDAATDRPPVLPLVLLGVLTVVSLGGPFGIVVALRGGGHAGWPPDRPVEWVVFVGVCAAVVALMAACLTSGLWAGRTAGRR